jgi:hypothetical protein
VAHEGGQGLAVEAEAGRHRAHHPVDGAALLGAAGEVDAAQLGRGLEPAGLEDFAQEWFQQRLEGAELLREGVDEVAPLGVALRLQPLHQAGVEALQEGVELGTEMAHQSRLGLRLLGGEGHAPHLGPLLAAQVGEEFHEPRHQVALGEGEVDGEADAELLVQLVDALLDGAGVGGALALALLQQVGHAHRHQHAVDGAAAAVPLEQLEEAHPGGAVHRLEAVLGGVAPGGVQQHRLVGEPPVAVAGAAHATDGVLAEALGQREVQPGVEQRRGLARAGRADDYVPGQLVDVVAAEAVLQARLLQHRQRLLETLADGRQLLG